MMMSPNAKSIFVIVVFAILAILAVGQVFFGYPAANECRHNSLLSRPDLRSLYSATCFLPSQKLPWRSFSMKDTIAKEWKWSLEHNGAISGQVIVAGHDFAYMLTQKVCVDRGQGLGRPMNLLYGDIDATAKPIGYAGDFNTVTVVSEPYSDCVFNKKQWRDYIVLNTTENISHPLTPGAVQYVRMHMGEFTGDGDILAPHNFNYSTSEIEKAFQSALDHSMSARRTERPMTLKVKPGKPIVTDKYPFETGLSIFSTADNLQGRVHRRVPQDISTLGWNRALASVKSQGGRPYPPPQFPDHMTLFDLLAIVLVSFISLVSFQQATELAFSARHANLAKWAQGSSGTWVRIKSRRDCYKFTGFFASGNADATGIVGFLGVVITILVAVRQLLESDLVYSEHAIISQAGVITHGASNPQLSIDPTNVVSGTEFAVSHWYFVRFKRFGRKGQKELIFVLCLVFLGLVCRQFYLLSLKMENKLDHPLIQFIALVSRYIVHVIKLFWAVMQGIAAVSNGLDRKSSKVFYEDEFEDLRGKLFKRSVQGAARIELVLGSVKRSFWNITSVPELPYREGKVDHFCESSFDNVPVMVDEVEKAAAVLAAAKNGRLSFPQALTLMCSPSLQNVVDSYISRKALPEVKKIKQLAVIYYVHEVLVPSVESNQGDVEDFKELRNIDEEGYIEEVARPLYAVSRKAILAPLLGLDDDSYHSVQADAIHDRIKYVTFADSTVGSTHKNRGD